MHQALFTNHDKFHIHKILGFGCLFNYFLRIYWLIVYGSMFIYTDYRSSLAIPITHLTLSLSSFIFQVPRLRLNSKISFIVVRIKFKFLFSVVILIS